MSVKAENRYKAFASREAAAKFPSHNDQFVLDLNAIPKTDDAARPFDEIHFVSSHGGWFAECPTTGYGFWYRTLREAVRQWRVTIVLDGGRLIGIPS